MRTLTAQEVRTTVLDAMHATLGGPAKDLNHALAGRLADSLCARLEEAGCMVTRAGPSRPAHGAEDPPVWLEGK